MTQFWLWFGCISMTAGAIFFGFGADRAKSQRWQVVYSLNFFICAIAAALYLAMSFKQGFTYIGDRPAYLTRYLTWTFSTPLTIVLLSYLGRTSIPIVASMVGADVYTIVTGFVATISTKPVSNIWYVVSCGAYLGLAYLLLKQYRQQAERHYPRAKKVFYRLLAVHLVIWTAYPIVWILASTGFNAIDSTTETACYTILDIAAKVGFGFLALNSLNQLEQAESAARQAQERSFSRLN
ncbi:MAG: bacteriorhodopsin [Cyanosarcina radialis HA8281-LM2]|jgi:bacteriorhodopsin|nr:bacteriorhodopsin [Cyanosarcina radialis HA8281-LM2]